MAHLNTPAHDFAPPWLKIPSYDTVKPSGSSDGDRGGHASRREGRGFGSARHTKESDIFAAASSSHIPYPNDLRRERNTFSGERKSSYFSTHPPHSVDGEDPFFDTSGSVHLSKADNDFNGTSANSAFALSRRPHSRHDFRNIPAYSKTEMYKTNNAAGGYGNQAKGKFLDSSSTNSNSIYNDNGGINVGSNNFNQEFPSLQGGIAEEHISPLPTVNGGAWEKPRNIKVHSGSVGKKIQLIKKPVSVEPPLESSKKASLASPVSALSLSASPTSNPNSHTAIVTPVAKGGSGGIYRALVPAKSTVAKKAPTLYKEPTKMVVSIKKPPSSTTPPSTHSMEILVKHPKAPGNKSDFLKALRNENKMLEGNEKGNDGKTLQAKTVNSEDDAEEAHTNGMDIAKASISNDNEKPLLSSSLEAEQRLLREMGWKEEDSDEDSYRPLTEDEMNEFQKVFTEKVAKKNGFRRNIQKNFSPRRLAPFPAVTLPPDPTDNSSSSESDSDD